MDVVSWILWLIGGLFGIVWSVAWFLLGGWVSTLAQIAVIVLVIFAMKYGWRRAPQEFVARAGGFGRFAWTWLRSGEARPSFAGQGAQERPSKSRTAVASRRRQPGDVRINVSTVMSLAVIAGLGLLAAL